MSEKTMKTKILLVAEIEHAEPKSGQSVAVVKILVQEALDAFREAVLPGQNYGITLYQSPDPHVALIGNLTEGFRAVGPFEDFDEAAEVTDGVDSWIMTLVLPGEFRAPEALLAYARKKNLEPEDLDELVHDAASQPASNVNNDGLEGQINFLIHAWGSEETLSKLKEVAEEKKQ